MQVICTYRPLRPSAVSTSAAKSSFNIFLSRALKRANPALVSLRTNRPILATGKYSSSSCVQYWYLCTVREARGFQKKKFAGRKWTPLIGTCTSCLGLAQYIDHVIASPRGFDSGNGKASRRPRDQGVSSIRDPPIYQSQWRAYSTMSTMGKELLHYMKLDD